MISIVTINFNNKSGLERTIESVKSQLNAQFEHLLIDGDSKDGSMELLEQYPDHFSYVVSEPDHGVYHAMNKGIRKAQGNYVLFLNSGDVLYENNTLDKVAEALVTNEDICYGNLVFKNGNGVEETYNYPSKLTFSFFYEKSLGHPATFIKRSLFDKLFYYNENFKIVSDWEFFILAVCKHNVSYKHLDFVISIFFTDGMSTENKNADLVKEERYRSLKNHFPLLIQDIQRLLDQDNLMKTNRFKMLSALESSNLAKKINSIYLRSLLRLIRGKGVKDL